MTVRPAEITRAILDAIEESGEAALLVSGTAQNPRKIIVTDPAGGEVSLWIYVWNLTPGGRPTLPNEYRIQMTSVTSPLEPNAAGLTLLLGYEPNYRCFAGFDLRRHRTFTAGSPSVQIDIDTLRVDALQNGFGFARKANDEIAVAFRPDQFMAYARNAEVIHRLGQQPETQRLLQHAASLSPNLDRQVQGLAPERQRIVQQVNRLARVASFRRQVLDAYGRRCAVSRIQLRLVEAAHILPVEAPGSHDDVTNGMALAPTYHRAYDTGLIFLDDGYRMRINEARVRELTADRLHAGLDAFAQPLGVRILLPADRRQWPTETLIRRANRFRGVGA